MIAILARTPTPGRCKTRLIPRLGARGAAQAQAMLTRRIANRALQTGETVTIWATPDLRHPLFLALRRAGCRLRRQPAGDLGVRMLRAVMDAENAAEPALILGTDCPSLHTTQLATLHGQPCTIVPALDGGYVALAVDRATPGLFFGVDWGTACVLRQTRRNLRRLQKVATLPSALPDLDTPRDWGQHRRLGVLVAQDLWRRT